MKNKLIISVVFMGIHIIPLFARAYSVKSDEKFYDKLMRRPLAVVMFYRHDKETSKNKDLKIKINRMESMFDAFGKQSYYQKGGMQFLKANIKYDSITELMESFAIKNIPAFLLFKNGVAIKNRFDKPITFIGWPRYGELEKFIRTHLQTDLESNIKRKAKEQQRLREAERWNYLWYRPYFYWGWNGYCPYNWGCGGCGGWYGGCGFGGGGCF